MTKMKAKILDDAVAVFADNEWLGSYGAHPDDLKYIAHAFRLYFKACKETGRLVSHKHTSHALSLWNNGLLEWKSEEPGDIVYNTHHPHYEGEDNGDDTEDEEET